MCHNDFHALGQALRRWFSKEFSIFYSQTLRSSNRVGKHSNSKNSDGEGIIQAADGCTCACDESSMHHHEENVAATRFPVRI
jgi:hypothetical protein